MPRGDKSAYTDKQKRRAEHIEEGYEKRGVGQGGSRAARLGHSERRDRRRQEERLGPRQGREPCASRKGGHKGGAASASRASGAQRSARRRRPPPRASAASPPEVAIMASPKKTAGVARRQRKVQREQDAKDRAGRRQAKEQEGRCRPATAPEPENPMPAQHLEKPGLEAEMDLQPRFQASGYLGSGKLDGMVALVTGGDSGIGRAVALLYAREGADVAIVYLEDEQVDAEETRRCIQAEGRRCVLIPGDVRDPAFCKRAVDETVQAFGRLDILVNNAAFQLHAAQHRGHHRRAARPDLAHQRLRLLPDGARRGAAPAAGRLDHQHRLGHRAGGQRRSCSTTRPPRARSTPSPSRWPATCSTRASASTRSRPGRCGRR